MAKIKHSSLTVDIHEMNTADAKKYLERLLASAGEELSVLEIIHGYNNGCALMEMVRTGVKSKKIKRRSVSTNPGITIFHLK